MEKGQEMTTQVVVISTLENLRQEDPEDEVSLHCMGRPHLMVLSVSYSCAC